jgi:hypothetical protein
MPASAWLKRSNKWGRKSAGMPTPVSLTVTATCEFTRSRRTCTRPRRSVNFTAFEHRFHRICRRRSEAAVLAPPKRFVVLDTLAHSYPAQDLVFLLLAIVGNEKTNGLADHLGGGKTEHPFGGRIPRGHNTVQIFADDRVVAGLHDRSEIARVAFEALGERYVARDLGCAGNRAIRRHDWRDGR